MNRRKAFGLVSALALGLSMAAAAAEPPAAAPAAPAAPAANAPILASDRWFSVRSEKEMGFMHISIKPSGDAAAPVRVAYESQVLNGDTVWRVKLDALCINDAWLSPVKFKESRDDGANYSESREFTITRPDPASTAGTMVGVSSTDAEKREGPIKERTVLTLTPMDLVSHFPFEKDKSLEFVTFYYGIDKLADCKLLYAGQEEVDVNGQKQNLRKCIVKVLERGTNDTYWLTDAHELVRAQIFGVTLTPLPEAEARKFLADAQARHAPAAAAARMSEGVDACRAIRSALRVYAARSGGSYPTLKNVTGDRLEATLHIAPKELDGKYFKAASYVVNSTADSFTVKATLGAQTYVIDENGVESGTYKTTE